MSEVKRILDEAGSAEAYVRGYLGHVAQLLATLDPADVVALIDQLAAVRARRGTVWLCGNGGSAATASHFANDLLTITQAPVFRVQCLADSAPVLTARANDDGYDAVFTRQLEGRIEAGDLLIALSVSGNSPNVLAAVDLARARGVATFGLAGFAGGALAERCDHALVVGAQVGDFGPAEGIHALLEHVVANWFALGRSAPR